MASSTSSTAVAASTSWTTAPTRSARPSSSTARRACPDLAAAALCSTGNGVSGGEDYIRQNTVENAILGTGNDTFTGSSFNNTVWPNGGQNSLNGCPDAVQGCGIDTVNYSTGYTRA